MLAGIEDWIGDTGLSETAATEDVATVSPEDARGGTETGTPTEETIGGTDTQDKGSSDGGSAAEATVETIRVVGEAAAESEREEEETRSGGSGGSSRTGPMIFISQQERKRGEKGEYSQGPA